MSIRNELLEEILAATGGGGSGMPVAPTGQQSVANGSQWERAETTSSNDIYTFDINTTDTDPGVGKLKLNAAQDELYISDSTLSGGSLEVIATSVVSGDIQRIQEYGATGNFIHLKSTGAAVDNGGWWTVPVSLEDSGGSISHDANVSMNYSATGARGGGISDVDEGFLIDIDKSTPSVPVVSVGFLTRELLEDLDGATFGNEVGVTQSDTPYPASVYDRISVTLTGGDIEVAFPTGTSTRNKMSLDLVIPGAGNTLTMTSTDGFEAVLPSGAVVADNNLTQTNNVRREWSWTGTHWRFNV